jgi:hypothetical protein
MVRIASFIVGGESGDNAPRTALIGETLAASGPPPRPPTASGDMEDSGAAAAHEGAKAFDELIDAVDFPGFVAGLIDGVFNAIVNASIKQMEAFAELVKNVAKPLDSFIKDNVTQNQARDFLADKYPDHLQVDTSSGSPVVKKKETADDAQLPDFFADLGLPSQSAGPLDNDAIESQLVPAAQRRIAMDRQQMLATMVMMGINRIIVTDGYIKANVIFDLTTKDAIQRANNRTQTATFHEAEKSKRVPGFFGWFHGYRTSDRSTDLTVQTVATKKDESQASVDMKAKLAGEVNVRFRSETFPLEKMTELLAPDIRAKVQGQLPTATPQPAGPPPPAPPMPTLPALPPLPGRA